MISLIFISMPKKRSTPLEDKIDALAEQLKAMSEVLDHIVAWIMEQQTGEEFEVLELDDQDPKGLL
jgi:hypothetical protein